jgi:hypothetical protein
VLFRVHGHYFAQESEVSRDLISHKTVDGGVILLPDVEAVDLERFLGVLYTT